MFKYIISFLAACLVPLVYWVGGFNFNERGFIAVTCLMATIYVFVMGMIFPYTKGN